MLDMQSEPEAGDSRTSRFAFLRKVAGVAAVGLGAAAAPGLARASATSAGEIRVVHLPVPRGGNSPDTITWYCCPNSSCKSGCNSHGYPYGYYCQNAFCGTECLCFNTQQGGGSCFDYIECCC